MDSERDVAAADLVMRTFAEPAAAPLDPQRDIDLARVHRALFGDDGVESPCIGHYQLVEAIGEGAMGEVYRAFDPVLQRDVAVKLVHRSLLGQGSGGAARLLQEARSLARLNHPNVVAVHDTGIDEHGRAWIAMEHVDGSNLRQWLREAPRSLDQITGVLKQAGRGLAAAHDCGLVHRDFKPDNVLVDKAGRARVGDFGVVRFADEAVRMSEQPSQPSEGRRGIASDTGLARTRPGALVGTVAYMSPEQLAAEDVDARSDQFSFCVTAWEALWGVRPFEGRDPSELRDAITGHELRRPRTTRRVPPRVERALRRGLAPRPADRFGDLNALLRHLDEPRSRRSLALTVSALAVAAIVVAARESAQDECQPPSLADIWDEEAAERTRQAILSTDVAYAATAAETIGGELSVRGSLWRDTWQSACEARRSGGESAAQTDRVMACLTSRRADLAALVRMLSDADGAMVERTVDGLSSMPNPQRCAFVSHDVAMPDASVRDRLDAVLASVRAFRAAGDRHNALPLAQLAEFVALSEQAPLYVVEARNELGELRHDLGDYEGAIADLSAGVNAAIAAGDDDSMAWGWIRLARLAASSLRDSKRARLWLGHASSAVERLGERDGSLGLSLSLARASVTAMDDPAAALEITEQIEEQALISDVVQRDTARAARLLAASLALDLGRFGDAERRYRALVAEQGQQYGDEHPRTGDAWYGLGIALDRQGSAEAEQTYRRALEIWSRSLAAGHRDVGAVHVALANVDLRGRRYEAAREHVSSALGIYEQALGPDDPAFAEVWTVEGVLLHRLERFADAASAHDRARRVYEAHFGEESIYVAIARSNAAEARLRSGLVGQASEFDAAARVIERYCGPECSYLGYPLKGLGLIALHEGRCDAAPLLASAAAKLAKVDEEDALEATSALNQARSRAGDCKAGRAAASR